MNRLAAVALAWGEFLAPFLLALFQFGIATGTSLGGLARLPNTAYELRERRFRVPGNAHFDGVDLADLLRIRIDLNKERGRNRESVPGIPGAAIGFAEARADGQNHVGIARGFVRHARAPNARH